MSMNNDTIERLKHEMQHGESSLDVVGRVVYILRTNNPELATEFGNAYERHADDEEGIENELLDRVYAALAAAPEFVDPFLQRQKDIDDLSGSLGGIAV